MKNIIKEHCRCQELQERTNDVDIICESCKSIPKNTCDCMEFDSPKALPKVRNKMNLLCTCLKHRAWCCFYTFGKEEHQAHWVKYYKLNRGKYGELTERKYGRDAVQKEIWEMWAW